jgi:hypothetical protein
MLTSEGRLLGITKALPLIKEAFSSLKELNSAINALPYDDAPYCVQTILLSGVVGANDGRNIFLFSAAVYLKKKYDDNFKKHLQEMNDRLDVPLEQKDIDSIYKSVTTHSYDGYGCKKPPCADYCDKALCALREYGVGKRKNNRFTGADCWGELSKVMAEEPYYVWDVRINPDDEFKKVKVNSVDDLQNQSVMQKRCWHDLNWAPFRVKDNDWVATVNMAMEGINERQLPVPKGTDTTEMGELRNLFVQYLLHRRARNGQPGMVVAGQVYYAEGGYYFTTTSILAFLRYERFSLGKVNLREQLISYGCQEAELRYKNTQGTEKVISCWKKQEDDELLEMAALYDDAHDADMEILKQAKEKEKQEGESRDDGVKF